MKRLGVYLRLALLVAIGVVILLVVTKNWSYRADFWLFGQFKEVPILWIVTVTSVASIIGWWIAYRVFRVMRELNNVQKERRYRRQLEQQQRLAADNAERERRIDEKLRRSITEES